VRSVRPPVPRAVSALRSRLAELEWVSDLWVAGSLATGDYLPGVSDLDLVALVDRPPPPSLLAELHRELDRQDAAGTDLGCAYVAVQALSDADAEHPTWTHGSLAHRRLSAVTRAELVGHGFAVLGRPPSDVLPLVSEDDVRAAARAEVLGYWAMASRRPWWWLDPVLADLGLTSMARGRYAVRHGRLLTKSEAIEQADASARLLDDLRARRRGEDVRSPRLRTAWIAWRDARRTVRTVRRSGTSYG
jgi:hypothetical protein